MKKLFSLFILSVTFLFCTAQPLVYFGFVTHNEDTPQWGNPTFYTNNRAKLITLANYFQTNGMTWNMQSDWTYLLSGVINQDAPFYPLSNNKNILRFLYEDKGVEMDPHGHENLYIYPDLVKLMDSIGLPESKIMGGCLYNQPNGINIWTNLINGQNGNIFPNKFWAPDYMMGGGTPMHVADLKYYGIWNPMDTANYLTHYPANHLRHMGVGCPIKIQNGDSVAGVMSEIRDLMQKIQTGQYPSNGFYFQSIFFEQADLNNTAFYNMVLEIADSVNVIVGSGSAQWKTMKQAYTIWETLHNAQMFQWECGDIVNSAEEQTTTLIDFTNTEVTLFDPLGRKVLDFVNEQSKMIVPLEVLPHGLYFYQVSKKGQVLSSGKVFID